MYLRTVTTEMMALFRNKDQERTLMPPLATMLCCVLEDSATFRFGFRIQNREPLHASQKTETACNPDLHRNRTPRGSETCWLYSGHLTVWRIARTERTRIPELPKARVEHAAGPSAAIPE